MQDFLVVQPKKPYDEFLKAELINTAEYLSVEADFTETSIETPFRIVKFNSTEDAVKVCSLAISVSRAFQLLCRSDSLEGLIQQARSIAPSIKSVVKDGSFRFIIHAFQASLSPETNRNIIEQFSFLDFPGKIDLVSPDHVIALHLEFDASSSSIDAIKQAYLSFYLCDGQIKVINKFDLKKRKYLGITSFDAELSLITSRLVRASPGKLCWDPFVGTGSFLYTSAHFGSMVFGSDIDGRQMRGSSRSTSLVGCIESYGLDSAFGDVWTSDAKHVPLRKDIKFDCIITDPPYGVRAGGKTVGLKDRPNRSFQKDMNDLPRRSIPSKKPLGLDEIALLILELAHERLKMHGRVAFWLPVGDKMFHWRDWPQYPGLELKENLLQHFSKWSRALLVFERVPDPVMSDFNYDLLKNKLLTLQDFLLKYWSPRPISEPISQTKSFAYNQPLSSIIRSFNNVPFSYQPEYEDLKKQVFIFRVDGMQMGFVSEPVITALKKLSLSETDLAFKIDFESRTVEFPETATDFETRSKVMKDLYDYWTGQFTFRSLTTSRDELFAIFGKNNEVLFTMQRNLTSFFGVVVYGVHVTAYIPQIGSRPLRIYVPKRKGALKKLDNSAAGGLMYAESPFHAMLRETNEEIGLKPKYVSERLIPAGCISQFRSFTNDDGFIFFQPRVLFTFDLPLETTTTLLNDTHEFREIKLLTAPDILQRIRRGLFRPQSASVLIDYFIRHGTFDFSREPDYTDILQNRIRNLEFPVGFYPQKIKKMSNSSQKTVHEHVYDIAKLFSGNLNYSLILLNNKYHNADITDQFWERATMRLVTDGALNLLATHHPTLVPDIICGDFDSCDALLLEKYKEKGISVVQDQDEYNTDFHKSLVKVEELLESKGIYNTSEMPIIACNAFGGRMDHVIQNMKEAVSWSSKFSKHSLFLMSSDNLGMVCRGNSTTKIILGDKLSKAKLHIGVVPVDTEANVSSLGLFYEMDNFKLSFHGELSTSNKLKVTEGRTVDNFAITVHSPCPVICFLSLDSSLCNVLNSS